MQLTCNRAQLLNALTELQTVVQSRVVQPALSCVRLHANVNELVLTGTNTILTLHLTIPCEAQMAGVALLPQRQLTEWLRLSAGEVVHISITPTGKYTIAVGEVDAKPKTKCTLIPHADIELFYTDTASDALANNTYLILPNEFERALRLTAVAALDSMADPRAHLHALAFVLTHNQLTIYATDSYRLALQTLELINNVDLTFMLLVQGVQTNLLSLLKQLQPDSAIKFYDLGNQVLFQLECKNFNALLIMQKVDGTPMKVLDFVPKDTSVELTLKRAELITALQAAQVFGKDNHNKVYLDFCAEPVPSVTISSTAGHTADGHENTLTLHTMTGAIQFFVILNALYFLEYLKASNAETLQISKRATDRSPIICRDMDALEQGLYLMMPMVEANNS